MIGEFAVPLMGVMGAVVLGNLVEEAAMPAYMFLGCLALLLGLLIASGGLVMPTNVLIGLGFVATAFALFGHVRVRTRS
jgi:hypothetical protein